MVFIDKPLPAKIQLALLEYENSDEVFIGLSGELYRQNLIFSEPRELRCTENILELYVTFRDTSSFKNWEQNTEIKQYWSNKFDSLLSEKPKTIEEKDIIIEVDNIKNCNCSNSTFYILQGRSLQFIDELTCSDCFGQIAYSKIPLEIKIEDWQTKHQRVYLNWLESGLFEKEAYKELTNYKNGKLNIDGEKIRNQLSKYFNKPVYINYFVEEPDKIHACLICGNKGEISNLKKPKSICKKCNTIFN